MQSLLLRMRMLLLSLIGIQQQGATRLAIGVQGGFLTDAQRFDLVKEHALALYDTATQQLIRVPYPDAQDRYPTVVCQAADAVIAHQVSALVIAKNHISTVRSDDCDT
jgi:hypothetical protein